MSTGSPSRIVVGIDGSPGSTAALRWAAEEAELHGATLKVVMAWGMLDQHLRPPDQPFDPHYNHDTAAADLHAFVTDTIGEPRAETTEFCAVCDLPGRALLDAAASADLLVVGARGLGGFKGLLLGSVSHHCLQHANGPVAVIHQGATIDPSERSGIVAAVDGSPTADRALAWAINEARRRKTNLTVVNAWQLPTAGYDPRIYAALDTATLQDAAQATTAEALTRADTNGLDDPTIVVRRGSPAEVILDVAADAELIVLGTRGRGALKRLLLGSVATQVTQHANMPVVVIPPHA